MKRYPEDLKPGSVYSMVGGSSHGEHFLCVRNDDGEKRLVRLPYNVSDWGTFDDPTSCTFEFVRALVVNP